MSILYLFVAGALCLIIAGVIIIQARNRHG